MKRLTIRIVSVSKELKVCCPEFESGTCEAFEGDCSRCPVNDRVWNKLADYEDIGLSPEDVPTALELANIACALNELEKYQALGTPEDFAAYKDTEEQGLLVKLPCKVGDTAFVLETENETGGKFRLFEGAIVAFQFTNEQIIVSIGDTGRDCWFSEADRQLSDIGHEWFLTREEAEAASEEANRNGG